MDFNSIFFQEKLKISISQEDGKVSNETPTPLPKATPGAPNKMMTTARQLSKGSLGLGESKMASTVMSAMGKKAQNSDAKPPPSAPSGPSGGPPKPSGAPPPAGGPPAGTPETPKVNPPNNKKEEEDEPKPSTSRKRHDSQGKHSKFQPG